MSYNKYTYRIHEKPDEAKIWEQALENSYNGVQRTIVAAKDKKDAWQLALRLAKYRTAWEAQNENDERLRYAGLIIKREERKGRWAVVVYSYLEEDVTFISEDEWED